MRELFSYLSEKERSLLRLLSLLFLLAVIFLLAGSLGQRRGFHELAGRLMAQQQAAAAAADKQDESAAQWAGWEEAYADIQEIKAGYFYQEDKEINQLRLDLEKILAESGINARSLRYNHVNMEKERVKKVNVTFNFSGSYPILKRFLEAVERFPKFLFLEKIDFLKISAGGNLLELKIILAGFYANF
jgi:Tfp pilus assembly protein PilO